MLKSFSIREGAKIPGGTEGERAIFISLQICLLKVTLQEFVESLESETFAMKEDSEGSEPCCSTSEGLRSGQESTDSSIG